MYLRKRLVTEKPFIKNTAGGLLLLSVILIKSENFNDAPQII